MLTTYEIIENGQTFATVRARSPENAIRRARREGTIYASDYNCRRGEIITIEWTARPLDGESSNCETVTFTARAK